MFLRVGGGDEPWEGRISRFTDGPWAVTRASDAGVADLVEVDLGRIMAIPSRQEMVAAAAAKYEELTGGRDVSYRPVESARSILEAAGVLP